MPHFSTSGSHQPMAPMAPKPMPFFFLCHKESKAQIRTPGLDASRPSARGKWSSAAKTSRGSWRCSSEATWLRRPWPSRRSENLRWVFIGANWSCEIYIRTKPIYSVQIDATQRNGFNEHSTFFLPWIYVGGTALQSKLLSARKAGNASRLSPDFCQRLLVFQKRPSL